MNLFMRAAALLAGLLLVSNALALDLTRVPYLSEYEKGRIERWLHSVVPDCRSASMLAVSRTGNYYVNCYPGASEADMTRIALQLCEHVSKSACGIVLTAGRMVEFRESPRMLTYPEEFDPYSVPFLTTNQHHRMLGEYRNAPLFKALALTRNGFAAWSFQHKTPWRAQEEVLKYCERETGNIKQCFVHSVGNKVIFDANTDIYSDR